jgi:radical SAM superfamily enzyme YgiQ (UPF0313 family)
MNVLLAKLPVKYPIKNYDAGIPLGLLYLANELKKAGHNVTVKDYRLLQVKGETFNYEDDIKSHDIIGTGACTSEILEAWEFFKIAEQYKKISVLGGIYPSANPKMALLQSQADYALAGECEHSLTELVNAIEKNISLDTISGLSSFTRPLHMTSNPIKSPIHDINNLFPAYDLIDLKEYAALGFSGQIYAGRGCLSNCRECTIKHIWGVRHRIRTPQNIIKEIELLRKAGFKNINFKDESFATNSRWTDEMLEALTNYHDIDFKVKLKASEVTNTRSNKMKRANISEVQVGIETLNQYLLHEMKKGITVEQIYRAFDAIRDNGMVINPVYMLSEHGETVDTLKKTADFIKEIGAERGVKTYINFMTPHPGLELNRNPRFNLLTLDFSRYNHKHPIFLPKSLGKNGLQLILDTYHDLIDFTGMQKFNPTVGEDFRNEVLKRNKKYYKTGNDDLEKISYYVMSDEWFETEDKLMQKLTDKRIDKGSFFYKITKSGFNHTTLLKLIRDEEKEAPMDRSDIIFIGDENNIYKLDFKLDEHKHELLNEELINHTELKKTLLDEKRKIIIVDKRFEDSLETIINNKGLIYKGFFYLDEETTSQDDGIFEIMLRLKSPK